MTQDELKAVVAKAITPDIKAMIAKLDDVVVVTLVPNVSDKIKGDVPSMAFKEIENLSLIRATMFVKDLVAMFASRPIGTR